MDGIDVGNTIAMSMVAARSRENSMVAGPPASSPAVAAPVFLLAACYSLAAPASGRASVGAATLRGVGGGVGEGRRRRWGAAASVGAGRRWGRQLLRGVGGGVGHEGSRA
nr:unnamed protein product [Digitaria exilis]